MPRQLWGNIRIWLWVVMLCLLIPVAAVADDFADYKTAAGQIKVVNLPTVAGGWFTAVDYFPAEATAIIDGKFQAKGRMIAANNDKIYLQRTYGSSQWDVVGTISGGTMDPSFIHVSPDGSKIALGIGYGAPLLIIPTSILNIASPPVLDTHASVKKFTQISYYDGAWKDNQYFVVNGGQWPGSDCTYPYHNDPDCVFQSGVGSVDTEAADPSTHTGVLLIQNIPGASSDVHVDKNGNLMTGLGYAPGSTNRTGELKVWTAGEWDPANPVNLNYEANTRIVAQNLLSVAHLGEDAEGNLHVGGGDAFGAYPPYAHENGYAAIIKAGVVNDIATGTRTTPVTDGNKADNTEYKYFAPDSCEDDSATGILAGNWGRGLAVMWNPTHYETTGSCYGSAGSASDYWVPGVTPRLTIYYPGSAPDTDGDGIPDASDNAYLTANAGQQDADGDGYGNAADADLNSDGKVDQSDLLLFRQRFNTADQNADMNSDGVANQQDLLMFRQRFNSSTPYY